LRRKRVKRGEEVAVDVSQVDPILAKLNDVYSGTTLYREKMDAWTLLRDITAEYASGNIMESELPTFVREIAMTICAQVASQGKSYSPEKLADELLQLVKQQAARSSAAKYMAMMERLSHIRARAREKKEGLRLL
jgi:hypothetical protein